MTPRQLPAAAPAPAPAPAPQKPAPAPVQPENAIEIRDGECGIGRTPIVYNDDGEEIEQLRRFEESPDAGEIPNTKVAGGIFNSSSDKEYCGRSHGFVNARTDAAAKLAYKSCLRRMRK